MEEAAEEVAEEEAVAEEGVVEEAAEAGAILEVAEAGAILEEAEAGEEAAVAVGIRGPQEGETVVLVSLPTQRNQILLLQLPLLKKIRRGAPIKSR